MSNLYYALGVVIFFAAILASIGLHELGHMIPAKAFGGKVTQYFIGFGPTVWSRRRGETGNALTLSQLQYRWRRWRMRRKLRAVQREDVEARRRWQQRGDDHDRTLH